MSLAVGIIEAAALPEEMRVGVAAELAGVSRESIKNAIDDGKLSARFIGAWRYVTLDNLVAWIERRDAERRRRAEDTKERKIESAERERRNWDAQQELDANRATLAAQRAALRRRQYRESRGIERDEMSSGEAAAFVGVQVFLIHRAINSGALNARQLGNRRYVRAGQLLRWRQGIERRKRERERTRAERGSREFSQIVAERVEEVRRINHPIGLREAAELARVSKQTIRHAVLRGDLHAQRQPEDSAILEREEVVAWSLARGMRLVRLEAA